jgi:hypothetical protein
MLKTDHLPRHNIRNQTQNNLFDSNKYGFPEQTLPFHGKELVS